jgi:hypothetical protein
MNYLKAVFWDYPELTNEEALASLLKEKVNSNLYLWIIRRMFEYGRVVDTFKFFKIDEIAKYLTKLQLRPYTLKKWERLIEVYGKH